MKGGEARLVGIGNAGRPECGLDEVDGSDEITMLCGGCVPLRDSLGRHRV
jgi:hypothetical protein